ncbi:MAG: YeeE/YedE family protein [Ralstonia sp.]|uniref:YeeE/YedE family protein n=1 Tax=Ralstonia pickettii TaxID=329 RepID=A0A9Q2C884_RALPI|nr:YeeE/YedE family protein [Ralstonia pickettii]MBA9845118.1 YeeE/YedE family protein [Ralstonia pickettii]MBA9852722.1 YeeE/YedE family protein [Ralstonia pickettii]MBA9878764.1 YeeE/YedE family protein [Ralstonia pickettii]MBA9881771.1 YeeE/YedE family protein [Ralstonia pickettii]MBA9888917.1 YeeE/YedE family protein [Ralstonia pickettii]
MSIDFTHFTPDAALVGGLIIGLAAAVLVLGTGRIAGISGIVGGLLLRPRGDMDWRIAFLIGLMGAPVVAALLGHPVVPEIAAGWGEVLAAGFLVGIGTRYAGGCTSGHGVCGLSRGSVRSLVATLSFMTAGIVTVFVVRHVFGG